MPIKKPGDVNFTVVKDNPRESPRSTKSGKVKLPTPAKPQPHRSFLRTYESTFHKHTDAPLLYHRACGITALGSLLTRDEYRCVLAEGAPRRWTNLWTVLVGPSGWGRKSTCVDFATMVLNKVDTNFRAPTEMTPEGMLDFFEKRFATHRDTSALLIYSEYSSLLMQFKRQYAQMLRNIMLEFYDVPPEYKRQLKKQVISLIQPRLSMLGGIATELLADMGTVEDWLGGMFSRTMFIPSDRTVNSVEKKGDPIVPESDYEKCANLLQGVCENWKIAQARREYPLFRLSTAGQKVRDQMPPPPKDPYAYTAVARGSAHFIKVAAIEQIDENPEAPEIGKAAAERALDFVMHWRKGAVEIMELSFARSRSDVEGDRLPKRLLRFMTLNGGTGTMPEFLDNGVLNQKMTHEAVDSLIRAGHIEMGLQGSDSNPDDEVEYRLTPKRKKE